MRLANGRNKILDKVKKMKGYQYLVMLDMDDINSSGKFVDSIDTSFKYDNWNVLAGNQTGNYYDIWALRQPGYIDYDCWKDHRGRPRAARAADASARATHRGGRAAVGGDPVAGGA
jgi:hypothetical protein